MKKLSSIIISIFILITQTQAQELVSPFAGSELVGTYSTEFEQYAIAKQADLNNKLAVEGSLKSNLYRKPNAKSTLEVFRSYEKELRAANFEILSNSTDKRKNKTALLRIYGKEHNDIHSRNYKILTKKTMRYNPGAIAFFPEYYLVAKKQINEKTFYVAIAITDKDNMYMVDVVEVAEMETGTVKISVELLKKKIGAEGKYLIYSIYFDTGKAEILPTSNETLEVVANYLKNIPNKRFYIVGHTDDTGGLTNNMDLSQRRASEVVRALQVRYRISQNQLEAKGVGPLAPVDSNETIEGRNLNRRVELVLRLD